MARFHAYPTRTRRADGRRLAGRSVPRTQTLADGAADRPRRDAELGSSLVEFMIAIAIFSLFSAATMMSFGSILTGARTNKDRVTALNLANAEIEQIRLQGNEQASTSLGTSNRSATVNGMTFAIQTDKQWVSQTTGSTSGTCHVNGLPSYIRTTTTVTWQQGGAQHVVRSGTIIAPPTAALDPNKGAVVVKVTAADGTPGDGILIGLFNGSNTSSALEQQTTTEEGCAVFAARDPGSYTVMPVGSGYVDQGLTPNPTQAVTVSASQATQVFLTYDRSATLNSTFVLASGATLPPGGLTSTVRNPSLQKGTTRTLTASTAPTYTCLDPTLNSQVPCLFPFTSGYTNWAGTCLDADPQGVNPSTGVAYWPGAVRDAAAQVTPGQTTADTITTATLTVTVTRGTPTPLPVAGITIKLTHAAETGGCTAGETYTLGTTNATGTLKVAVPFGNWTAQSVNATGFTGTSIAATLSPLSPNVSVNL